MGFHRVCEDRGGEFGGEDGLMVDEEIVRVHGLVGVTVLYVIKYD